MAFLLPLLGEAGVALGGLIEGGIAAAPEIAAAASPEIASEAVASTSGIGGLGAAKLVEDAPEAVSAIDKPPESVDPMQTNAAKPTIDQGAPNKELIIAEETIGKSGSEKLYDTIINKDIAPAAEDQVEIMEDLEKIEKLHNKTISEVLPKNPTPLENETIKRIMAGELPGYSIKGNKIFGPNNSFLNGMGRYIDQGKSLPSLIENRGSLVRPMYTGGKFSANNLSKGLNSTLAGRGTGPNPGASFVKNIPTTIAKAIDRSNAFSSAEKASILSGLDGKMGLTKDNELVADMISKHSKLAEEVKGSIAEPIVAEEEKIAEDFVKEASKEVTESKPFIEELKDVKVSERAAVFEQPEVKLVRKSVPLKLTNQVSKQINKFEGLAKQARISNLIDENGLIEGRSIFSRTNQTKLNDQLAKVMEKRGLNSEVVGELEIKYKMNPTPEIKAELDTATVEKQALKEYSTKLEDVNKTVDDYIKGENSKIEKIAENLPDEEESFSEEFTKDIRKIDNPETQEELINKLTPAQKSIVNEHQLMSFKKIDTDFVKQYNRLNPTIKRSVYSSLNPGEKSEFIKLSILENKSANLDIPPEQFKSDFTMFLNKIGRGKQGLKIAIYDSLSEEQKALLGDDYMKLIEKEKNILEGKTMDPIDEDAAGVLTNAEKTQIESEPEMTQTVLEPIEGEPRVDPNSLTGKAESEGMIGAPQESEEIILDTPEGKQGFFSSDGFKTALTAAFGSLAGSSLVVGLKSAVDKLREGDFSDIKKGLDGVQKIAKTIGELEKDYKKYESIWNQSSKDPARANAAKKAMQQTLVDMQKAQQAKGKAEDNFKKAVTRANNNIKGASAEDKKKAIEKKEFDSSRTKKLVQDGVLKEGMPVFKIYNNINSPESFLSRESTDDFSITKKNTTNSKNKTLTKKADRKAIIDETPKEDSE